MRGVIDWTAAQGTVRGRLLDRSAVPVQNKRRLIAYQRVFRRRIAVMVSVSKIARHLSLAESVVGIWQDPATTPLRTTG